MANTRTLPAIFKKLWMLGANARGTAAIEFGVTGLMLVVGLLNAVDVGFYIYSRMEVENAAEAGAQAAWNNCPNQSTMLPATQNCTVANGAPTSLNDAIDTAIQSTSLQKNVSRAPGYPTEAYYCVNSSNALQFCSSVSSKPANCSCAGNAAAAPGDYIQVQVTYAYSPLFPGPISVMSALGITSITKTSWMRMG